ncbi:signal transduction histidine kinase [Variovorax boronicumulans]|uniref:histidine kinase n=1 Tax=Variovorax boronicumulans TaxID=436515 RepID=A0AAW8DTL0_9BURK|nr:HAMP domain-containing sensor histidine kinase [Variovorax boronicumulans]MDP9877568.1 signal transduction histidine kinase [Variovorax boronicumulans]MDP9922853.1 signal transduction histidine kinase [Variovorax boronicumulans]
MRNFLTNNREELISRCKSKVALRPRRAATEHQLSNGIPLFLEQLIRTLAAEEGDRPAESILISGPSGGGSLALSEMGVTATAHGKELLNLGYTIDQVVHDYGDLCQAITDLAFERDAPFAVGEFRTLNRCLDNAIADAVTEFSFQRDTQIARQQNLDATERFGFLVHELRNSLGTATLAIHALELGNMTVGGATGTVLKRSLSAMGNLISRALADVRSGTPQQGPTFSAALFIQEAQTSAQLVATAAGCALRVSSVDPLLAIRGNRELLLAALANLLQNAFKFSHPCTDIALKAYGLGEHVLIEVEDRCGGLPPGIAEKMFLPFNQHSHDRSGLGLGLSIARQSIEADFGTLTVRDVPGTGCVFTISLPRHSLQ